MKVHSKPAPPELIARVSAVVARDGQRKVSARWGINREVLACALAGYPVRPGTVALLTLGLQKEDGNTGGQ